MQGYAWISAVLAVVLGAGFMVPPAVAQSTGAVPQVQAVYGGTVGTIVSAPLPGETNKSRLFVTTDSANSVFYADIDHSLTDPFATNNYILQVMPDMDANANLGQPWWLDVHQPSMRVFAACDDGLYSCTIASNSLVTNITGQMAFVLIEGNYLFAVSGGVPENHKTLYYGTLSSGGTLTLGAALSTTFLGSTKVAIHPLNRKLYVLETTSTNSTLYQSSSDYDAFSSDTTFALLSVLHGTGGSVISSQLGIGPDGRVFVGRGNTNLVYTDGAGWTTTDSDPAWAGSGIGLNIEFNGSSNAYEVYYGYGASSNKGEVGTWAAIPRGGRRIPPFSHANSGSMAVDPVNSQAIYFTTDKGIGASTNLGVDAFELNYGLTAVQINDFDMSASKDIAWLASKAGTRRATGFNTSPVWTDCESPNAIVHSVAMEPSDPSGLTAYIGSGLNVFKTTTGGGTNDSDWIHLLNIRQGDSGVTNGINDGECRALQVEGSNIYAGFYSYNEIFTDGRLYLSTDSGQSWTPIATNINVNDIIINTENNVGVAYIAGSRISTPGGESDTDQGGVYRHEIGSVISRDLTNSVYMRYLARDSSGGLYASGAIRNTDPGTDTNRYHVVVYYKTLGAAAWSALTTNGLPTSLSDSIIGRNGGPIITIGQDASGNDIPILAIERTLYTLPQGASEWVTLYTYPNGTAIKVLYWDDLMVGTTIGLYGQDINARPPATALSRAADFDGDRKADPAVYTTNNQWVIWMSSLGYTQQGPFPFGAVGATPVVGDFDGDRVADPAVYTTNSQWVVWMSSSGYAPAGPFPFSFPNATPAPADFDGDGLADPAVFLDGYWLIWMSSGGYAPQGPFSFGYAGTTPVPADYDGDQRADPAVFADGYWVIWMSGSGYQPLGPLQFGIPNTLPVPGDFDADGKADPAVVLAGSWYIWMSGSGYQMTGPFIFTI